MPAISKSWVTIADGAVDPDSPLDTALMTGLRDDLVHLREWLGASYYAGAVQNHSHDGQNSALVEIGPNQVRNGSFETGTEGWTLTNYTGGSIVTDTSNHLDGSTALAITSTVLGNGGGDAISAGYISVAGAMRDLFVNVAVKASASGVSSKAEVVWYDQAKAQISTSTIYNTTNTGTSGALLGGNVLTPPSNARYARVKLTGGIPGVGSAVGTIYFDGIVSVWSAALNIAALATVGIGSYVLGWPGFSVSPGTTVAGSNISFCSTAGSGETFGGVGAGTWLCCGGVGSAGTATVFRRVA